MSWKSILQFISWVLGLFVKKPSPTPSPTPDPTPPGDLPDDLSKMVYEMDRARVEEGLVTFRVSHRLMQAAGKHAKWMADNTKMDHEGENGSHPADRIKEEGYFWQSAGENIAMGYTLPVTVVSGWMKSPGHRANILSKNIDVGVGHAISKVNGRHYWAAVFASPMLAAQRDIRPFELPDVVLSGPLSLEDG